MKKGALALCLVGGLLGFAAMRAFTPSARVDTNGTNEIAKAGGQWFRLKDGRVVEWFEYGASLEEAKTTILALHGAMTTGKLWEAHDAWGREKLVRIIAPSLPGWGCSESDGNTSPKQWAASDAVELLKETKAGERVHLLGASLGSIYAAELLCAAGPKAIGNVMLYVAIAPKSELFDPLEGSDLNMFSKLHGFNPTFARLLEKFLFIPLLRTIAGGDVARSLNLWEGLWRCTDDIKNERSSFSSDLTSTRKVFVVSATQDTAAPPANQRRLIELIPGSTMITYEGGHDAAVRDPKLMQEHLSVLIHQ
jgi:pimeloyl-ACP methyl ester carboxylesterase